MSAARSRHFLALFAASLYLALLGASGSVLAQDQGEQPQNPALGNESSKRFDQPPILLSGKAPAFPLELQVKGSFETVTIQFTIDEEGKTKDFKVLDATKPFAANLAVDSVGRWIFRPAAKDGKPVAVRAQQRFEFRY